MERKKLPVSTERMGRPTLYEPALDDVVYKLRLYGLIAEQIADVLSISQATLYHWLNTYESFKQGWQRGGTLADAEVSHALYQRAKGYKHKAVKLQYVKDEGWQEATYTEHYPPDTAAGIFWLANRSAHQLGQAAAGVPLQNMQWKQRITEEHTGPNGSPLAAPSIIVNAVDPPSREE